MELLSVVGIALIAVAVSILLRQYRPEFAMPVSLAAGIVILLLLMSDIGEIVGEITAIGQQGGISGEYLGILIKALAICFLTQIACDSCKDAGESAIASKVEMAGRIAVLTASLPLFRQVLEIVGGLMSY